MKGERLISAVLVCFGVLFFTEVLAQPTADFAIPANACRLSDLAFTNQSTLATSYVWDFCQKDLESAPTLQPSVTADAASIPLSLTIAYDRGNWYGFVSSRNNAKLIRLNFGASLANDPTFTDLGNIGGLLDGPHNLRLEQENGQWYGILINFFSNTMVRLAFPAGLASNPTAYNIGNLGNWETLRGLDLAFDGTNWVAIVSSFFNDKVSLVNFGNSLTNNPSNSDVLQVNAGTVSKPIGVKLIKAGNNWVGLIASHTENKLWRLNFGTQLYATPTFTQIASFASPTELVLLKEGLNYHSYVLNASGQLLHLAFGDDPVGSIPVPTNIGNFGSLANTYSLDIAREGHLWYGVTLNYETNRLYRFKFQGICNDSDTSFSTSENPVVQFRTAGSYQIDLFAKAANGELAFKSAQLDVEDKVAPELQLSYSGICATQHTEFTATQVDGQQLTNPQWTFSDGHISNSIPEYYQLPGAGMHTVVLSATTANGCSTRAQIALKVYDPPTATFVMPAGLICTNNEFLFSNTTVDVFDGNLKYSWSVGGQETGTNRDLRYTFTDTQDQVIKLKTSIPGCDNESQQSLSSIKSGPTVGFEVVGQCEGENTILTNTSLGSISGYKWALGDGSTINSRDGVHLYSTPGTYTIVLETTGTNGCVSVTSKDWTTFSKPAPVFSLDLPPFSCTGSPSQFHDLTLTPNESNIQTRAWTFGDSATGSGKDPVHTYTTAGDYPVTLVVTTDKGCSATKTSTVTISPSPTAEFSVENACLNKAVHFTSSSNEIKSWQWKIDNSNYTVADPTHIFLTPGNRSVTLKLTGTNDCIATATKTVYVPPVPLLDFEMTNPCVGQESVFVSNIVSPDDLPANITWQFEDASPLTGSTARFAFSSPGTHPVGITVRNQSGCSYQLVKNVTTYAAPVVNFNTSTDTGPAPLEVDFTNTTTGAVSYRWLTNGVESATASNFKSTFSTVGDYAVDLIATSDRGCTGSITKNIKVIIPRTELALTQFNLFEDPVSGALRNQLLVTNSSNYPIRSFDVILDLGNGSSIRETINEEIKVGETSTLLLSNSLVAVSSGYVCAEVVLAGDEKTDNNKLCTPLAEQPVLFTPSPNPATDVLNVEVIAPAPGASTARIVNSMGQLTFTCELNVQKGLNRFELDIRSLQPGVYFLTFETGNERRIHRLVIN